MTKTKFRVLVVMYIASWSLGVYLASTDATYEVSRSIGSTPFEYYRIASLIGLFTFTMSVLALLLFWKHAPRLFGFYLIYLIAYKLVYGAGHGGNLVSAVSTVQQFLAGGILVSVFFSSVADQFGKSPLSTGSRGDGR